MQNTETPALFELAAMPSSPLLSIGSGAYRVLARKYRPKRFSQVVGQEVLVRLLTQALKQDRLGHGFLFSGIRGIGKTTTARLLACALNCLDLQKGPQGEIESCGVCASCVAFEAEKHLDIVEMDAASHTGVDDVREILEACRYRPVLGRYKIFIIDEVHMLSKSAFNALLKTLEEPPEHVKFIFATTEIRKIPATVISRCLRFDLKRLDSTVLLPYLIEICRAEGVEAAPEALFLLARAGAGSARDALSLLDQAIVMAEQDNQEKPLIQATGVRQMLGLLDREAFGNLFQAILEGNGGRALTCVSSLGEQGIDPLMILEELANLAHQLSCLKVGVKDILKGLSQEEKDFLERWTVHVELPTLGRFWQMLLKGRDEVERASFPQKALEMVLVRLAYVAPLPTPDQLLNQEFPPLNPTAQPKTVQKPVTSQGLSNFQAVIEAARLQREGMLGAHLLQDVILHSFAEGRIEMSLKAGAPPDLPQRLQRFLFQQTGCAWQVLVSSVSGETGKTLAEQEEAQQVLLRETLRGHPVFETARSLFPGVVLEDVQRLT